MARYKEGLKRRGVIRTATVRSPLRSLTSAERESYFAAIDQLNYLDPVKF